MASSDNPMQSTQILPHEEPQSGNDFGQDITASLNAISQPVEMSDLSQAKATETPKSSTQHEETIESLSDANANEISSAHQPATQSAGRVSEDESAIGPATERPLMNIRSSTTGGPQLVITLLLHSTDTRHPYILSEKYLLRRNIQVDENDPINLTVYNLKDLIWRDWRDDWETRPASPASIRLIHMGRMLDDKAHLKDSRFTTGDSPHVVHMSIKPQEVIDDEDAKMAKGNSRDRDISERGSGCRCAIM